MAGLDMSFQLLQADALIKQIEQGQRESNWSMVEDAATKLAALARHIKPKEIELCLFIHAYEGRSQCQSSN